jgi:Mrp family chromosome partitioning ATPase/capsular polysaccharide biosynthesis protein
VSPSDDLQELAAPDLLGVLWRRLWLVALVAIVCAGTAFLVSDNQSRKYEGVARLLYQQPTDVSDPTSSRSSVDTESISIQLQSVSSAIDSPAVRDRARTLLDGADLPPEYEVTAAPAEPDDESTRADFLSSVDVSAVTPSPSSAARLANAYAAAVIALRKEETQKRYAAAQRVVEDQLKLYPTPESQLTADYAILTQQLHNLQIAEATATGDFTVIVPATPPESPISPQPMKSAALGLGLGIIVGLVVAYASARLDTRVRTSAQVAEIVGLPAIGRIPRIPRHSPKASDLVSVTEPHGHVSEALRMVRSSLEWAAVDSELKSLLVTSCVKGEGKTLTISNLAVTLARSGNKVVIVDGDLRAPRLHTVFEMPNAVGLTSVVLGWVDLDDALQTFVLAPDWPQTRSGPHVRMRTEQEAREGAVDAGSLQVLTSGPLPPDPGELIASKRMSGVLEQLHQREVDYILVDAPPLLVVGDAGALASSVDGLVLLASIDKARRPILRNVRDALHSLPCRKVGVVVVGEPVKHKEYYSYRGSGSQVGSLAPTVPGKGADGPAPPITAISK